MKAQTALPDDHPMMRAWLKFCDTDEFKNALRWAVETKYDDGRPIDDIQREQHAKGSLWLAFTKGMEVEADIAPDFYAAASKLLNDHGVEAAKANFQRCGCEFCLTFAPIVRKADGK